MHFAAHSKIIYLSRYSMIWLLSADCLYAEVVLTLVYKRHWHRQSMDEYYWCCNLSVWL